MILHSTSRGEGPVLVLLHGLFGQSGNFGAVQRRLAVGRRVVAMDLRNHGASPHAPGMDYRTLAADVAETIAALGLGPCAILGHSMGGKAAMALALARPDLVSRLCVADIAPVRYRPHLVTYALAMRAMALAPGLSRAAADAALAPVVADAGERAFLLSNLVTGATPRWFNRSSVCASSSLRLASSNSRRAIDSALGVAQSFFNWFIMCYSPSV
jgi:pimeloyl-ACP methyl ester carboxylesterase